MSQTAYIVTGFRSAVGKAKKGGFKNYRSDDLAADVIKHLVESVPNLDPTKIDDLIVGNAIPEGEQGMQMGRLISLLSLPLNVPGMVLNRYCGSGLEAIGIASARIKAGMADCIIAGGTESMSLLPMMGYKPALNWNIVSEHPEYMLSMGLTAEEIVRDYKITREEQDAFSVNSHKKALKAIEEGKFKNQIVPVEVEENYYEDGQKKTRKFTVDTDEGPRAGTSMEGLGRLRPAFASDGTVTAGNSSQTSDGAAFVLVMSEKMVEELGLKPRLKMLAYTSAGVDPRIMGIGPVAAVPKALKLAGLKLEDIDVIELNEAFAAQSLAVIRDLKIDESKVNPNGGAIALGHPLGCTGAKLTIQLMNELESQDKKYGMVTACIGGGQGIAGIFERVN
ncbi:acetyl-CoA acetyltransferase [Bernardetia litoralis DSM 6794]|uniref:acetyl-CoA C-acyltransferase n=1 Tax=Bernardetia litoralis (strain ATCC 23117 / DSM 6794 / NBRC 15988 / NCIMB 1366 / Fx l1 / Sio-4) TaxID=880071 RepID=I4APA1_BERLS|nr:acetyl-CoA C-acyltransferase [Bernardetia litoralis]AFM05786.1 acetyl-CoA acetyltransferase [Bernardetia litoralis DSM 6794]